jgi:hypothetical protein
MPYKDKHAKRDALKRWRAANPDRAREQNRLYRYRRRRRNPRTNPIYANRPQLSPSPLGRGDLSLGENDDPKTRVRGEGQTSSPAAMSLTTKLADAICSTFDRDELIKLRARIDLLIADPNYTPRPFTL